MHSHAGAPETIKDGFSQVGSKIFSLLGKEESGEIHAIFFALQHFHVFYERIKMITTHYPFCYLAKGI